MPSRERIAEIAVEVQAAAPFSGAYADLDPFARQTVDAYARAHEIAHEDALAALLAAQTADAADHAEAVAIAKAVRR